MKDHLKKFIPKQKKINQKVSLFLVGAQKSGTSALHNYLIKHPQITGGKKKEINFFNHLEKYKKGESWYHHQFNPRVFSPTKKVFIDSTPQYLNNNGVARKIYNYNPDANIVILLREPVSRAYSAWNMYKQFSEYDKQKKEKLIATHIPENQIENFKNLINRQSFISFDDYVDKEVIDNKLVDFFPQIIQRGIYVEQIKPYIELFGIHNVLIFESDQFRNNKLMVTNQVVAKLGLKKVKLKSTTLPEVNSREYQSQVRKSTKEKLKSFYEPYNQELFRLINQNFDW